MHANAHTSLPPTTHHPHPQTSKEKKKQTNLPHVQLPVETQFLQTENRKCVMDAVPHFPCTMSVVVCVTLPIFFFKVCINFNMTINTIITVMAMIPKIKYGTIPGQQRKK